MDASDPANPQIVHAFVHRDSPNYRIEETWDTLGMRATQSHDTILDRTFVPDAATVKVCPAGFAGADMYQVALFAWGLLGFAGVYTGIAQRAFDEVTASVSRRTSVALTRSMAYHPEVQHHVAEMRIRLEAITAHLDRVCADWSTGVDHGMEWPLKIVACKYDVVTRAWEVVDTAIELTGGSGVFKRVTHRAAVPRRPHGPLPPRQHPADPRAGRQDEPRHQPRRAASLGLTQVASSWA